MLELRSFDLADADVRGRTFRGRALVYGQSTTLPLGDGRTLHESIERGAFAEATVPLFREHRAELLLARNSVKVTHNSGIDVEAELLQTAAAEEARALVDAGELRGMSIGFLTLAPWKWARRGQELHRSLPAGGGKLVELSLVALPAHEGTSASVRSIAVPDHLARVGRDTARWSALLERLSA